MSQLPPAFFDELRERTTLSDVVGRKVTWDMRRSNSAQGVWWAPCPFHQEKTPSFKVDDRQGRYFCFGCQAKGDAITFLRETENMEFMEAVERLAEQAGMQMPARDPRARAQADRSQRLALVMEAAVAFFCGQWGRDHAQAARAYMTGQRGLDGATLDRFEIGYAPDSWDALFTHLTGQGHAPDQIVEVGLARTSQKGGKPYDLFRNRVMFPIRDPRGRCIAFGGRALDPGEKAKYINSPETPLFDKSRTLFNLGPARIAAGKGAPLIVAEGYMDVIALARAGFDGAVAPLGTAMTEHHLDMLWRVADEPVIALDGDRAGLAAAGKAVDLALPRMVAGKGLRFCLLPDGKDPDDVIADGGAAAMQALLDSAQPMVRLLWRMRTDGKVFDSPDRRAALDKVLRADLGRIADLSLRRHYGVAIRDLRSELFDTGPRPVRQDRRDWRSPPVAMPVAETRARAAQLNDLVLHEAVILATLITHPTLIDEMAEQIDALDITTELYAPLLAALLRLPPGQDARAALDAAGHGVALASLFALPHVRIAPSIAHPENIDKARGTLLESLRKHHARCGYQAELAEADTDDDPYLVAWRLAQAAAARNAADIASQEDDDDYERMPSGAIVRRADREAFEALLAELQGTDPPSGG